MVKAIFFDIDGTLISFKTHKIPQSTIKALNELHNKGIKLFTCTGRPPADIKFLTKELHDLFDGYITLNGQYCYDKNDNIIHEQTLDKNDLTVLTDYLKDKDIACGFIELDYFYYNLRNQYLDDFDKALGGYCTEKICRQYATYIYAQNISTEFILTGRRRSSYFKDDAELPLGQMVPFRR